ncbi:hypothetical protein [Streptomyces sp. NPDC050548]|uniref:hypothetical protein n=1 Tax=Streptomyces sp. NPDC050548 TaxID=3365629 RepID=UPI0037AFAC40
MELPPASVLTLTAPEGPEGPVVLSRTGSVDLDDLERRMAGYWHRHQTGRPPRGPLQTARFLLDRDKHSRRGWLGRVTDLLRRDRAGHE